MTNVMQGSTKTLDQVFHILYWRYLNIVINTEMQSLNKMYVYAVIAGQYKTLDMNA